MELQTYKVERVGVQKYLEQYSELKDVLKWINTNTAGNGIKTIIAIYNENLMFWTSNAKFIWLRESSSFTDYAPLDLNKSFGFWTSGAHQRHIKLPGWRLSSGDQTILIR